MLVTQTLDKTWTVTRIGTISYRKLVSTRNQRHWKAFSWIFQKSYGMLGFRFYTFKKNSPKSDLEKSSQLLDRFLTLL